MTVQSTKKLSRREAAKAECIARGWRSDYCRVVHYFPVREWEPIIGRDAHTSHLVPHDPIAWRPFFCGKNAVERAIKAGFSLAKDQCWNIVLKHLREEVNLP